MSVNWLSKEANSNQIDVNHTIFVLPMFQIVSCSGDGIIAYNDVERADIHGTRLFNCHYGTAYEVNMPVFYCTLLLLRDLHLQCGFADGIERREQNMQIKCHRCSL